MTDERPARNCQGRKTVSQDILCTLRQTNLQGSPPSAYGGATLRNPSTHLLEQSERYASIMYPLGLISNNIS
ncbi:unnamed protein product [Protopolystoma xenopodis]|uniref:Uncharacterized protein n=1 Tax=Protopolystoma xenopodis TaxID=117903 RepID=A0A3S5A2B3_9PLAT|nr:unnamed protein product [Protopolystoma xenopodis]